MGDALPIHVGAEITRYAGLTDDELLEEMRANTGLKQREWKYQRAIDMMKDPVLYLQKKKEALDNAEENVRIKAELEKKLKEYKNIGLSRNQSLKLVSPIIESRLQEQAMLAELLWPSSTKLTEVDEMLRTFKPSGRESRATYSEGYLPAEGGGGGGGGGGDDVPDL